MFRGIPLGDVTGGVNDHQSRPHACCCGAMCLAVAEQQGVDWSRVSGTLQNDIPGRNTSRRRNTFSLPKPSMCLVTDTIGSSARGIHRAQPHLHQRISHPRGGVHGGAGAGVHTTRWHEYVD